MCVFLLKSRGVGVVQVSCDLCPPPTQLVRCGKLCQCDCGVNSNGTTDVTALECP